MSEQVMTDTVLDIDNLVVSVGRKPSAPKIIDGISLQVRERETLCLVGESGSGKSVAMLAVMGLLPEVAAEPSISVTSASGRTVNATRSPNGPALPAASTLRMRQW